MIFYGFPHCFKLEIFLIVLWAKKSDALMSGYQPPLVKKVSHKRKAFVDCAIP